jgi:hypothetical protein
MEELFPTPPKFKNFAVYYLGKKIGHVVAKNSEDAKKSAMDNFEIDTLDCDRITVDYPTFEGEYEGHVDIYMGSDIEELLKGYIEKQNLKVAEVI